MIEPLPHILLVEDDQKLSQRIQQFLSGYVLRVSVCENTMDADDVLARDKPDVILLDINLPGRSGLEWCKVIRAVYARSIIMLTARSSDLDQFQGLESGADDYLIKPIEPMILLARVRAHLRRHRHPLQQNEIRFGGLAIFIAEQRVLLHDEEIHLTDSEFTLLTLLARSAGTAVSREWLFSQLIGRHYDGVDRTIDGRISRLRKKIGDDVDNPKRIRTVWGKGYVLVAEAWSQE